MLSKKQLAANRLNARKSTGPRTSRGKLRASRNAFQHGFAAVAMRKVPVTPEIKRIADALHDQGACPLLCEQALVVAECEWIVEEIRAARSEAIEQMKALARPRRQQDGNFSTPFPTKAEFSAGLDAFLCGNSRPITDLIDRGTRAVLAETKKRAVEAPNNDVEEQSEVHQPDADREHPAPDREAVAQEADEATAFQQALLRFVKLDRYYQRALSRRRRAMRDFRAKSLLRPGS